MEDILFSWDENKNLGNIKKHGISFEEARTVFADDYGRLISDPDHSQTEDRFILLGLSHQLRVLLVCHCYRQKDGIIRIISARKANKDEIKQYREFRHA